MSIDAEIDCGEEFTHEALERFEDWCSKQIQETDWCRCENPEICEVAWEEPGCVTGEPVDVRFKVRLVYLDGAGLAFCPGCGKRVKDVIVRPIGFAELVEKVGGVE